MVAKWRRPLSVFFSPADDAMRTCVALPARAGQAWAWLVDGDRRPAAARGVARLVAVEKSALPRRRRSAEAGDGQDRR
jgi:hypothetical protein